MSIPDDMPRVMAIWRAAIDATHDFLDPRDRDEIEAALNDFLPRQFLWLAVDDRDEALGFMLLEGARVEALFVHPDHHGRGVGRRLLAYALRQVPCLEVDVNEQNGQAAAFYRHMGFHAAGRSETDGQGRPYPLIHLVHGMEKDGL